MGGQGIIQIQQQSSNSEMLQHGRGNIAHGTQCCCYPKHQSLRSFLVVLLLSYRIPASERVKNSRIGFVLQKNGHTFSSVSAVLFASKINISAYEQLQTSSYALLKAFRNVLFSEPQQLRRP